MASRKVRKKKHLSPYPPNPMHPNHMSDDGICRNPVCSRIKAKLQSERSEADSDAALQKASLAVLEASKQAMEEELQRKTRAIEIMEGKRIFQYPVNVTPCTNEKCVEYFQLLRNLQKTTSDNTDRRGLVMKRAEDELKNFRSRRDALYMENEDLRRRLETGEKLPNTETPMPTGSGTRYKLLSVEQMAYQFNLAANMGNLRIPMDSTEYVSKHEYDGEINRITARMITQESEHEQEKAGLLKVIENLKAENRELSKGRTKLEKIEKQVEELSQRKVLKAVLTGDESDELEVRFRSFFVVMEDASQCKFESENVLYDAFFGSLSNQEKEAFMDWMYCCCGNGKGLPDQFKKRAMEADCRAGKQYFHAILAEMGGVYMKSYKGHRYVWTNVQLNLDNSAKKRKADEIE